MAQAKKQYEVIAGSTIKLTLVSTGVSFDHILCNIRNADETIVGTGTVVSSGDGHYYCIMLHPNTPQWVVNEWVADVNANTYVSRQFGEIVGRRI